MVPLWSLVVNKMLLKTLALQTKSLDYNKSTLWDTMGVKRKTSADMLPCSLYCVGVWLLNWEASREMICLCPHSVSSCLCCQCTMGNDWCLCPRMSLLVAPDVLRRVTRVCREWEYAGKTNFTVSHIVQSPASAQLLSTSVWAALIRINWRGNSSFYKWVPNVTFISLFKNKHFCLPCKWEKSDLKDNLMTWNV